MEPRRAWDRQYRDHGTLWRGERAPDLGPLDPDARVLELGCGNGKALTPLVREGRRVVGLDFSRSALHGLRRRAAAEGAAPLPLVAAEATRCPFRDASFDAVRNHHVLPHLTEPGRRALMAECRRVLRPGGALSVEVFAVDDLRFGKGAEIEPSTFLRGNGIPTHHFSEEELRGLAEEAGFAVRDVVAASRPKRYDGRDVRRSVLTLRAVR